MRILRILNLLAFLFYTFTGFGQSATERWSYQTASIQERGKWESGIIQPFRLGINDRIEVFSNLLLMPFMPNAGIKVGHGEWNRIKIASEHLVSLPSIFLNTVSRKGTGGLLSPEFDFPFMIALSNSLIGSVPVSEGGMISGKIGMAFTLRGDKPDPLSTIDLSIFYPRMAHYYKGVNLRSLVSYKGRITSKWFYEETVQAFMLTRQQYNFFFENSGNLMWSSKRSIRIKAGYQLTYGTYPYGKQWQIWPAIDVLFGSRGR